MSDGISISLPLFFVGAALILYGWLRLRPHEFHSLTFIASLLAGFITAGVVWRLDRFAPLLMAGRISRRPSGTLWILLPFALYAILWTLLSSLSWDIPDHVNPAYGEFRYIVQLFNFISMCICTWCVSRSFLSRDAPHHLYRAIAWITAINIAVATYQYVARSTGLPQIGISRSYDELVRVAAFSFGDIDIFRPGALVGEPKALAALMVLYLVVWYFKPGQSSMVERGLAVAAAVILVLTFSTTALVTLLAAGTFVLAAQIGESRKTQKQLGSTLAIGATGLVALSIMIALPATETQSLLYERYIGRLQGFAGDTSGLDQIALMVWADGPLRMLFGLGLGGISFYMMPFVDPTWALAYAPNIGIINVLCDLGVLGLILLTTPIIFLIHLSRVAMRAAPDDNRHVLRTIGICLCALWLFGSGPSLGLAMGLGLLSAASSTALGTATTN